MDDKQKPQEVSQPQAPTVVSVVDPIQQPITSAQANQLSASEKPKLIKSLLALLVLTFWLGLSLAGLVIRDIRAGVFRGEPETGWGILFALFLVGPPFLIFGLITLIRVRRLRKDGQKIGRTVKFAGIITAILLVISGIYGFGMSKYEDYANRDRREQGQRQAELNKNEAITIAYATELLNICKLRDYIYGDYIKSDEIKSQLTKQNDAIILVKLNGNPRNIHVGDKANIQLLPVAENAKKNCPDFSINGQ